MKKNPCPWKGKFALGVLSLLLVACGERPPTDHRGTALLALEKGDLHVASIQLKSAIQGEPQVGELRYMLALVQLDQGDPGGALVELRKAAELGFGEDGLTAAMARALVASKKYKEATDTYGGASLQEPSARAELGVAMAVAWLSQRSQDKAASALSDALSAKPDFGPALLVRARAVATENKIDEAIAMAERAAASGPRAGDAHLFRGVLLIEAKRDRPGAMAAFEEAAKQPTSVMSARWGLVHLHAQSGDLAKAKEQLVLLQKAFPGHPNAAYLAAVLAYAERDYAKAESLTDALLKLAPDSERVLTLSGATHLRQDELVAAEAKLGKVVQTVERAPAARRFLAETYLRMGQPEKALGVLKPLLETVSDGEALALAAQAHLQRGAVPEAEAAFAAAVKLKPDDVGLRTSAALTELAKGRPEAAFESLERLAREDTGLIADLALTSALLQRREFDRALEAIGRLESKQPNGAMPRHLRGLAMVGKGDLQLARQAFEAALKMDPKYAAAMTMLASLDTAAGHFDAAQERIEAALKVSPKSVALRMAQIDVLQARKSSPEVVERAIDEAIRQLPNEAGPHLAKLAHVSRHRGAKAAGGQAQVALAALPDNARVLDAAGVALAASGDHQQALSAFNRLASAEPRSPVPYLRLADMQTKQGNRSQATSMLNRAFDVAPMSPDVHRRLLDQAVRTRDYRPVLAAAKELKRLAPGSAAGHLLKGATEATRKDWTSALAAYQAALKKPDGAGQAERMYYTTLKQSGQSARAQEFAANWLQDNPKDVHLRGLMGSEALVAGRKQEAELIFRQIIDIEPRSVAALNNVAWLLAERGDPGALPIAERALALSPHTASVLDTMAKALVANDQLQRAIEFQKRAVDAASGSPAHRLTLAQLYVKAGDKESATRELDHLSSLGSSFRGQAAVASLRSQLAR